MPVLVSDCTLFGLEGIFSLDSAAILANKTKVGFVSGFVSGGRVSVVENSCKHSFLEFMWPRP